MCIKKKRDGKKEKDGEKKRMRSNFELNTTKTRDGKEREIACQRYIRKKELLFKRKR